MHIFICEFSHFFIFFFIPFRINVSALFIYVAAVDIFNNTAHQWKNEYKDSLLQVTFFKKILKITLVFLQDSSFWKSH